MTRIKPSRDSRAAAGALDPSALFAHVGGVVLPLMEAMDWVEEEIAAAGRRHPGQADLLYHAFGVLTRRHVGPGMGTEFVYRGHAREMLDRVAAGKDLRPATAAAVCLALSQVSRVTPLHGAGVGLYLRMWLQAFSGHPITAELAGNRSHYEHLLCGQIDDLESMMRREAADRDRQLGDIECQGSHHGGDVACRFATTS